VGISASGVPSTARQVLALLLPILVVSGSSVGVGLLFALMSGLLAAKRASGILGDHVYSIQSDGLREQTSVNDTLLRWGGAQDLIRTSAFLLIRIGPALFHILPRRSFSSVEEYNAFWRAIQPLKRKRPSLGVQSA
jgi:hypothetical protein